MNLRRFLAPLVLVWAVGCVSAFGAAIERGDAHASAGAWDRAVAEYEYAVRLDPRDEEALGKLHYARRRLSLVRVEQARWHLARKEPAAAMRLAAEAAQLDPASSLARQALAASMDATLAEGEDDLAGGRAARALEAARLVRRIAPADPRAVSLEDRARTHLAEAAYAQAEARLSAGKPGAAMLSFVEADDVRRGHRDAAERAAKLRAELSSELSFHAVFERAPAGANADLAAAVEQEVLGESRDPARPLLRLEDRAPPEGAIGIRMSVQLAGYHVQRDVRSEARSCLWVCGVDHVPNPALDAARREELERGRRVAAADDDVVRARGEVERRQRELDRAERALSEWEDKLSRAKDELTECESRPVRKGGKQDCGSEAKRVEGLQWRRNQGADAVNAARDARDRAQHRVHAAHGAQRDARAAWESAVHRLANTPATLAVDRTCNHDYEVAHHTVSATVQLVLRAGVLGSGAPSDLPAVPYDVERTDATHAAAAGRCAEVATGDPLVLPNEAELRAALVERVAKGVLGSVRGSYDEYREGFADEERAHRAAGRIDDADEARARWLLTGPA